MTANDNGFDIEVLALVVAKALLKTATDDAEPWEVLTEEERIDLMDAGRTAITAQVEWLKEGGFRILPAGAFLKPQSLDEAKAMAAVAAQFATEHQRNSKRGLIGTVAPKLIIPPGVH